MDLQEIRNYVRGRYSTDLTDAELDDHINEAYKDVSNLFTPDSIHTMALTTTSGQSEYVLPEHSRRIRQIRIGSQRLRSIRYDSVVFPRLSGSPIRWYPYGWTSVNGDDRQAFGLDPIPTTTAAITILVEPQPNRLVDDHDSPEEVPDEFQYLICWMTISLAAGQAQDYNVAQNWDARYRVEYNEVLAKMAGLGRGNFPDGGHQAGGGK